MSNATNAAAKTLQEVTAYYEAKLATMAANWSTDRARAEKFEADCLTLRKAIEVAEDTAAFHVEVMRTHFAHCPTARKA